MAARISAADFRRQIGPFALVQKPPPTIAQRMALELGARQTMMTPSGKPNIPAYAFIFAFDEMVVATVPPLQEGAVSELTVGRLPSCDLVIDDPSISKQHAVLRWDSSTQECFVTDLGSTNGTLLNGASLWQPETRLKDWDMLSFGDVPFCFVLTSSLHERLARPVIPARAR